MLLYLTPTLLDLFHSPWGTARASSETSDSKTEASWFDSSPPDLYRALVQWRHFGAHPTPGHFLEAHMTTQAVVSTNVAARATVLPNWSIPGFVSAAEAGKIVVSFVDAATTSLGRATHYN